MDHSSTKRFITLLRARHEDLRGGLSKGRRELLSAQHDHAKDEGDKATASLLQEINLLHNSRNQAVLGQIDAALKRINDGSFGECLNCEQEINRKRLEAIPWVPYCITCQELLDSTR
jgi:DnaK suppressor protein